MPAEVIDGTRVAQALRAELTPKIETLRKKGITPGLAVVLVGDNPASRVYVRKKGEACREMGMHSEQMNLDADTPERELLRVLDRLNGDPAIHGILVQLPLPRHIDERRVLRAVRVDKDVDGFHPENVGKVVIGDPSGFAPATPAGVQQLLLRSGVDTRGAHVVIVGRSNIVGRPLAALLLQRGAGADATVTVCHSRTPHLSPLTRTADILVAAVGRPEFITGDMIKSGAVVVDVGVNRVDDSSRERGYRLVGDVDFEAAREVASAITPVPGGVGPMTITMLLSNTVQAATQWAD